MDRRALLLINRKSRQGAKFHSEAVQHLKESGIKLVEPDAKSRPDEAIRTHASKVDLVIVGGGDGSLNAAADEIAKHGMPLGILPLGTANDLARTLSIPTELEEACRVIAEGYTRKIDLGRVNGKGFFNVASIGLSVAVTKNLSRSSKGWLGVMAYLFAAVKAVGSRPPFRAEIRCDGITYRGRTIQVTVGNGRHYGGGLTVAEDAAPDDYRLDVYSLEVNHWLGLLPLLPALRRGDLKGRDNVRVLQGREIEIHTTRPRSVSADGEVLTRTPALFTIQPGAITVFTPREKA